MKKIFFLFILLFFVIGANLAHAENTGHEIIYFYSPLCGACQDLENNHVLTDLESQGITITKYEVVDSQENKQLMYSYAIAYGVPIDSHTLLPTTPLMFVGSTYYHGYEDIYAATHNGSLYTHSGETLLNVPILPFNTNLNVWSTLLLLLAGLIDGINPCAMAMLITFVSLLIGFKAKKATLISIAISYILGLFLTYFALGTVLLRFVKVIGPFITPMRLYINIGMAGLVFIFFAYNLYDFFVSRNEEYEKVKNQLPKGIQKFNRKLIKTFTNSLDNKNIYLVYAITFLLGAIISMTEFMCTGQIYLPTILLVAQGTSGVLGVLYILLYNIMFIIPLVILAVLVISLYSAVTASNKIREMLHWIKLVTAIVFLGILVYYLTLIF